MRRRTKSKKTSLGTTYYITSLDFDIQAFADAARSHWNVENGLHWSLDVVFREDDHRYQDKVGAANLFSLRKTAINILSIDKSIKKGSRTKMMLFASSSKFRDHVLKICF